MLQKAAVDSETSHNTTSLGCRYHQHPDALIDDLVFVYCCFAEEDGQSRQLISAPAPEPVVWRSTASGHNSRQLLLRIAKDGELLLSSSFIFCAHSWVCVRACVHAYLHVYIQH